LNIHLEIDSEDRRAINNYLLDTMQKWKFINFKYAYLLLIHLALFIAILEPGILVHAKRVWAPNTTHNINELSLLDKRHRAIDQSLNQEANTLFFGDSITVGLPVSEITNKPVNFGADHETTQSLANRIGNYDSISGEGKSVLLIGTNNIGKSGTNGLIKNYHTIISTISENRPLLVYGIFPVDESASKKLKGFNQQIIHANMDLKILTNQYENAHYRSINPMLVDSSGNLKEDYHIGDGVHLTHHGYRHWVSDIRTELEEI